MRRIGIFGGAFDPIHMGHLRVIRDVLNLSKVDEVMLMPNAAPPYRKPQADLQHVRAMAEIATQGMDNVSLVDQGLVENAEDTVQLVTTLRKRYKDAQITYIIGADKLAGLLHWRQASKLFSLCDLLVYQRAGYNGQDLILFAIAHGIRAQLLPGAPIEVYSALVRSRVEKLSDAEGMLIPQVAHYIARHGLYQPPWERMVKQQLTPRRFAHTLGVRDLAVDLALQHGLPMQKASAAALLHDCAKCMKLGQLQAIAREYRLTDDPRVLKSNALLHGPVGAVMARAKYGVTDERVLDAIRWHTTGRAKMTGLELCLFVADKAEAGRPDYPGLSEIRELMYTDLRLAALRSMRGTAAHVKDSGQTYSPHTQLAMEDLLRVVRPLI